MNVSWSPNAEAYMSGKIDASEIICALCGNTPCVCPPFGHPAYFVLIDFRHGIITKDDPEFIKYFRVKEAN